MNHLIIREFIKGILSSLNLLQEVELITNENAEQDAVANTLRRFFS